AWGYPEAKPQLWKSDTPGAIELQEPYYGHRWLYVGQSPRTPDLWFTNNESNCRLLWGTPNPSQYVKDGIGECLVRGNRSAVHMSGPGTKAAAHYVLDIEPGQSATVELRLTDTAMIEPFGAERSEERRVGKEGRGWVGAGE